MAARNREDQIRFQTDDVAGDFAWITGKDNQLTVPDLKLDPRIAKLTLIGLIIAFGLSHS